MAREALRVYAPLAGRLGMHRLKASLEGLAFRFLYRRQHAAATAIYGESEILMAEVTSHLTDRIEEVLRADSVLEEQLGGLRVTSRVKAPFSLWRKLVKTRAKKTALRRRRDGGDDDDDARSLVSSRVGGSTPPSLSSDTSLRPPPWTHRRRRRRQGWEEG